MAVQEIRQEWTNNKQCGEHFSLVYLGFPKNRRSCERFSQTVRVSPREVVCKHGDGYETVYRSNASAAQQMMKENWVISKQRDVFKTYLTILSLLSFCSNWKCKVETSPQGSDCPISRLRFPWRISQFSFFTKQFLSRANENFWKRWSFQQHSLFNDVNFLSTLKISLCWIDTGKVNRSRFSYHFFSCSAKSTNLSIWYITVVSTVLRTSWPL